MEKEYLDEIMVDLKDKGLNEINLKSVFVLSNLLTRPQLETQNLMFGFGFEEYTIINPFESTDGNDVNPLNEYGESFIEFMKTQDFSTKEDIKKYLEEKYTFYLNEINKDLKKDEVYEKECDYFNELYDLAFI